MRIRFESPNQPDVVALIDELDAYQTVLYPPGSHHGLDIDALLRPQVLFAVAREHSGEAIGCGAVVLTPQYGELKRMFVRPAARGRGIAKALLNFLEAAAADKGCRDLMLETGISQPEALGLYAKSGYMRRGPFGAYADDPYSVFMHKRLVD